MSANFRSAASRRVGTYSLGISSSGACTARSGGRRLAVHLVGAVDEARVACEPVEHLERHVGRVAEPAVDLHRAVDDVVQHLAPKNLIIETSDPRGSRPVVVDLPRRVERHQPRGLHLGGGVGDPVLHGLRVTQQPRDRPVERALAQHVERSPRHAEPAHAVVDPARDEPLLGDQEALALLAEQGVGPRRTSS